MTGRAPSNIAYTVGWDKRKPLFDLISADISLSYVSSPKMLARFLELSRALVDKTDAVVGFMHNLLFPGWELLYDLNLRLPDPGWKIFFGKPYVDLFGVEQLRTVPCHRVEQLPSGHFEVTLTENPLEPIPLEVKQAVRQHLGVDAFMDPGKTSRAYKTGLAPQFDFSQILKS